jgi:hypothetical protein
MKTLKNKLHMKLEESLVLQNQQYPKDVINVQSSENEVFPASFDGIPDVKAVYKAMKKREILRQVLYFNLLGYFLAPLP